MAPLYTDAKVLGQFLKKLLKSVGLNCAGDRGPSFHDMNFFYRVIPSVRQLALAMCLRATQEMTLETLFCKEHGNADFHHANTAYCDAKEMFMSTCMAEGVEDPLMEDMVIINAQHRHEHEGTAGIASYANPVGQGQGDGYAAAAYMANDHEDYSAEGVMDLNQMLALYNDMFPQQSQLEEEAREREYEQHRLQEGQQFVHTCDDDDDNDDDDNNDDDDAYDDYTL